MSRNKWMMILFTVGITCTAVGIRYKRSIHKHIKRLLRSSSPLNQKNPIHLKAGKCIAKKKNVSLPQEKLAQISSVDGLIEIVETKSHAIDSMTHSKALLTQEGKEALDAIGVLFQKKLQEQGYQTKKILVTSMVRSLNSQKSLSKSNVNAAKNSAHVYGSTFDISYRQFRDVPLSKGKKPSQSVLVKTLEKTLVELNAKRKIVALKEYRQPCFHITASCFDSP